MFRFTHIFYRLSGLCLLLMLLSACTGTGTSGAGPVDNSANPELNAEADAVTSSQANEVRVRVVAYNVEKGSKGSPADIGELFKRFQPDLVAFCEVPDGDWTAQVGEVLDMDYAYVGKISSSHHNDKYKSILSRTPLSNTGEIALQVGRGWNPASAVRAETIIDGLQFAFYSLHIARSARTDGHAYQLAEKIRTREQSARYLLACDFNNEVGDPAMDSLEDIGLRPIWHDLDIPWQKMTTVVKRSRHGIIDHILYNEASGAKASAGGVLNLALPLSDHKPVYAEIVFPRDDNPAANVGNAAEEEMQEVIPVR